MVNQMNQLWSSTQKKIEHVLSAQSYKTWIKPIKFIDIINDVMILEVQDEFHKREITSRYLSMLKEIISNLTNDTLTVELKVTDLKHSDTSSKIKASIKEEETTTESFKGSNFVTKLNSKYTFENFVCGSSNEFAHAASLAVSENPAEKYNPLFIYGGTGLGKTHLMVAIGNQILRDEPNSKICYYTSETFMNEMVNCIRHRKMEEFRSRLRKADILLIDDIQFMANKEATQEEFFHTFNALYESHKQIVVTSDKFPKEIPGLEERLRSRFEWGLIADIQPPNTETKIAILKKKAEINEIDLPDDVALLIGSSNASNIRELEGMLVRIGAFASLTKNKINITMAREILKDIIVEKSKEITIEFIQKTVADYYKLKVSDLKSEKRLKNLVIPRQMAIYLCREMTKASFPEIGEKFGGKDHSTVIYSVNKIGKLMEQESEILTAAEQIRKKMLN